MIRKNSLLGKAEFLRECVIQQGVDPVYFIKVASNGGYTRENIRGYSMMVDRIKELSKKELVKWADMYLKLCKKV